MPAAPAFPKPYALTNLGNNRAKLEIRGLIGESKVWREYGYDAAGTVIDLDRELKALGNPSEIEMYIHSTGGEVFVALGMRDVLMRHPAKIMANVDGIAGSAATLLLLAADPGEITVPANSYLFIHDPSMPVEGNHRDVASAAIKLKQWAQDMADLYTDRIVAAKGGDRTTVMAEVIRMMEAETYLTGRQAVELGLADRMGSEVALAALAPAGGPAASVRLEKVPAAIRHLFDSSGQTQNEPIHSNSTPLNMSTNPAAPSAPAPAAPAAAAPAAPAPAAPAAPAAPTAAAPAADPSTAPTAPTPAPTAAAPAAPTDLAGIVAAAVTAAITPLQQQVTALQTEVSTQKGLAAAGVSPTACGGNQPPAPAPAGGGAPEAPVNLEGMHPRALIKLGRERMHQK